MNEKFSINKLKNDISLKKEVATKCKGILCLSKKFDDYFKETDDAFEELIGSLEQSVFEISMKSDEISINQIIKDFKEYVKNKVYISYF